MSRAAINRKYAQASTPLMTKLRALGVDAWVSWMVGNFTLRRWQFWKSGFDNSWLNRGFEHSCRAQPEFKRRGNPSGPSGTGLLV